MAAEVEMVSWERSAMKSKVEDDVEVAAGLSVPVLITAPPDQALEIARDIARRAARTSPAGIGICDMSAGGDVVAALSDNRMRSAVGEGTETLVLQEVHMLSEIEQEAMMRMFDAQCTRSPNEIPRIISTSSVSLYGQVKRGAFDPRLFHRLNVIHIVISDIEE
jgi:hypothetical protein